METNKDTHLIIYHREDNDGLFSAAILFDYLTSVLKIDKNQINLFGATYNDMNNFDVNKLSSIYNHIAILDLSFNDCKKMKNLYKKMGSNLVWIDHHKPAIIESTFQKYDDINGLRNPNHSTIILTYQYLYDEFRTDYQHYPEIYKVLSAWDSWSWVDCGYDFEKVKNINQGVNIAYQLDFDSILDLVKNIKDGIWRDRHERDWIVSMENKGINYSLIKDYENKLMIDNYGDLEWVIDFPKNNFNNRSACALFIQGPTNSQIFKSIKNCVDNGIIFKRTSNGDWNISLYNTNDDHDFHCGNYLKEKYGGGGHEGAAGATITNDQFFNLLKTKKL